MQQINLDQIGVNDQVLVNGAWLKVEDNWRGLVIETSGYKYTPIKDLVIEGHRRYVPKARYGGSFADVEAFINDNGKLIYLELAGQEGMVKAITSVLMQGRVKLNEENIEIPVVNWFDVHKAGNKRKLIDLGNGIAHAIVYHAPSIAESGFSVLIGRDEDELLAQFGQWMEKSQPLPYPKELVEEIFTNLKKDGTINEVKTRNILAVKINEKILENNFADLQDVILDVCRKNGLIAVNAVPLKPKAPLPKSPILTSQQVQAIYDKLAKMPKTYETEDMAIKPIGVKLFTSNMTWYVVEADIGCDADELVGLHPQAFGYVFNETYQEGEWGYINIEEVVSVGAEMDLFFDNKYIKAGKIDTMDNLTKTEFAKIPICPICSSSVVESSETVDGYHHYNCIDCGEIFKRRANA